MGAQVLKGELMSQEKMGVWFTRGCGLNIAGAIGDVRAHLVRPQERQQLVSQPCGASSPQLSSLEAASARCSLGMHAGVGLLN